MGDMSPSGKDDDDHVCHHVHYDKGVNDIQPSDIGKMWGTCHHLVMMMIMCATIIIMIKMIMIRNHLVLVVSRRNGDDDGNMSQFDDCGENDASPSYT